MPAMGFLERLINPLRLRERTARQLQLEAVINAAMDGVLKRVEGRKPPIFMQTFYGAISIDPRFLAVWYIFKTEDELRAAKTTGFTQTLDELTRELLDARGYPNFAVGLIAVSFTSDEDIFKKTGGDYPRYFK
ncbi:MAG TPA: hypothetical protein VN154_07995 [Rhizomicrobium sp.]|nr:hypothetical protein [Rhizomicrobium sp.]